MEEPKPVRDGTKGEPADRKWCAVCGVGDRGSYKGLKSFMDRKMS